MPKEEAAAKITRLINVLNLDIARDTRNQGAQLPNPPIEVIETKTPATLLTLPAEIRNQIWELLLVNRLLSMVSSVSAEEDHGAATRYGLCPSLLGLNKQVKAETESILYQSNVFYVTFLKEHDIGYGRGRSSAAALVVSPLTRCLRSEPADMVPLGAFPEIQKVRHWRAVICIFHGEELLPNSLDEFCRAISRCRPQTMQFCLIRKDAHYRELSEVLAPLITMITFLGIRLSQCVDISRSHWRLRFRNPGKHQTRTTLRNLKSNVLWRWSIWNLSIPGSRMRPKD